MKFEIIWQLSDEEWEKARQARKQHSPGSDYDDTFTPLYDLLYGPAQMVYGPDRLFPEWQNSSTDGLKMSILDLAVGLHSMLQSDDLKQSTGEPQARYTLHEIRLTFSASRIDDVIEFTVSESHAQPLFIPAAVFKQGIGNFLQSFVAQVKNNAPELLGWESLTPLRSVKS